MFLLYNFHYNNKHFLVNLETNSSISLFNSVLNLFGSPIYISITPVLFIFLEFFFKFSICFFKISIWNSFSFNLFSNKNLSVLSFSIYVFSCCNLSFSESCNLYNFFANSPFSVKSHAIFSLSLSFSFFKSNITDWISSELFFFDLIWEYNISLFICKEIFERIKIFLKQLI